MVLGEIDILAGVEKDEVGIDKEVSDDFADVRESPVRTNPTNKSSSRLSWLSSFGLG